MSRHDELRKTWREGERWETRNEESELWVPVGNRGYAEPVWDERQEYRRVEEPVGGLLGARGLLRPDQVAPADTSTEALYAAEEALGLLLHDAPRGEFSLQRTAWNQVRAALGMPVLPDPATGLDGDQR